MSRFILLFIFIPYYLILPAQNWQSQNSNVVTSLSSINMQDSLRAWAFGAGGSITYTSNGGQSWLAQASSPNFDFNDSQILNDTTLIAGGEHALLDGFISRSTDGGQSWISDSSFVQRINGLSFPNPRQGWAVGRDGFLIHSTDGGQSWSVQTSGSTERLFAVHFVDSLTGWIAGRRGTLRKTTNGGTSWTSQSTGSLDDIEDVYFLNANRGWTAGEAGAIYATTNGGITWTLQSSGTTVDLFSLVFINDSIGWAGGLAGNLRYTQNGGQSWGSQNSATTQDILSLSIQSQQSGWLSGGVGAISHLGGTPLLAAFQTANSLCEGEASFFLDGSSGSINSWAWDFGDGSGSSSLQNPSYIYAQPGTYTVRLIIIDQGGQQDTAYQSISIHPLPLVNFSISQLNGCAGDSVHFTDLSSGSINVWHWTFGDQNTSNMTNPSHIYSSASLFQVWLRVQSNQGCTDSSSQFLQINAPVVNVSPAAPTICAQGDSVVLLASGAQVYQWSPPLGLDTTSGAQVIARPFMAITYQVVGIDSLGCQDSAQVRVQIDSTAMPVSGFLASQTLLCEPSPVQFSNTSLQATSFLWSFPGGNPSSSTQADPLVSYTTPGSYSVQLIALGCSGNDTLLMDSLLEVRLPIKAAFSPSSDTINLQNTQQVQFNNQSSQATDYIWYFGNGDSSHQVNPIATYSNPGIYTVRLLAAHGLCLDSSSQQIVVLNSTPVAIQFPETELLVYPIPAQHTIWFEIPGEQSQVYELDMYSLEGKALGRISLIGGEKYSFNRGEMASGMYFYHLSKGGRILKRGKWIWGE